jgi:hypothetical protein
MPSWPLEYLARTVDERYDIRCLTLLFDICSILHLSSIHVLVSTEIDAPLKLRD